jgi:hypothetical protein
MRPSLRSNALHQVASQLDPATDLAAVIAALQRELQGKTEAADATLKKKMAATLCYIKLAADAYAEVRLQLRDVTGGDLQLQRRCDMLLAAMRLKVQSDDDPDRYQIVHPLTNFHEAIMVTMSLCYAAKCEQRVVHEHFLYYRLKHDQLVATMAQSVDVVHATSTILGSDRHGIGLISEGKGLLFAATTCLGGSGNNGGLVSSRQFPIPLTQGMLAMEIHTPYQETTAILLTESNALFYDLLPEVDNSVILLSMSGMTGFVATTWLIKYFSFCPSECEIPLGFIGDGSAWSLAQSLTIQRRLDQVGDPKISALKVRYLVGTEILMEQQTAGNFDMCPTANNPGAAAPRFAKTQP